MKEKEKNDKTVDESLSAEEVNEPLTFYWGANKIKPIIRFLTTEQQEQDSREYSASLTHEQRLKWLEEKRKATFKSYLLPDGNFPPLKKVITIRTIPNVQ